MMDGLFYKRMFFTGAAWNILGGLIVIGLTGPIFRSAGLNPPHPPAYYYSWIVLFMVFGIGYYMVYRDMYANKNIVILGIVGKLGFSAVFIANMVLFRGQIPLPFAIAIAGDLIYVLLFASFIRYAAVQGRRKNVIR